MTFKKTRKYFLALLFIPTLSHAEKITEINGKLPSMGYGSTYISGPGVSNKEVVYQKIKGLAIVEGDIVLGTIEQATQRALDQANIIPTNAPEITTNSIFVKDKRYLWPSNVVPYQIEASLSLISTNIVKSAIAHYHTNTQLRFVLRTANNADRFPNYLSIVDNEAACWSYPGMIGKKQEMNIYSSCSYGATIHEFGHAIGLWHEQSRADRNLFVTVNKNNIRTGYEGEFDQHITDGTDVGDYDYGSIMHYGRNAFGKATPKGRAETITPIQPSVVIGQRKGLSPLDIAGILQYYPTPAATTARLLDKSYTITEGETLYFNASTSNGAGLLYQFNSGDGFLSASQTTPLFNHTYNTPGNYDMTVTVTDYLGITSSAITNVTVEATPIPLVANFFTRGSGRAGNYLTFDASLSTGKNIRYEYTIRSIFGFPTTFKRAVTFSPFHDHFFEFAGDYDVQLVIVDPTGARSNIEYQFITIF